MEHYANAFHLEPGRCFRMVARDGGKGPPTHCTEPVALRGRFRDGAGRTHRAEACEGHADALTHARQIVWAGSTPI
ncbi:MAG TPA: hypothetical protein VFH50_12970 [Acidimicrobiales bacterium]|nr:hypothetical protein [Acidimicrobiales bacterium]